jgi:glycosyltransferase involved in cell wall biosynthesis
MSALVSIIIRTHNAAAYLPALLESLHRQDFRRWEIVAVIHNCTDRSEQILREAGAQIVYYPSNLDFNYSHALNLGAEASSGKYLLNLSSHVEIVRNDTIGKMVQLLETENLAAVTVMRRFSGERYSRVESIAFTDRNNFRGDGGLANFCGMIPRFLWEQHPFSEAIPAVEDSAWAAYWIYRGHRTGWLHGHAITYKNPRYSVAKLVRDRALIALFLSNDPPSVTFDRLSQWTRGNVKRYVRSRQFGLLRIAWIELIATWKLLQLSRSIKKQEIIREQMLRDYPQLPEYLETYLKDPATIPQATGSMDHSKPGEPIS